MSRYDTEQEIIGGIARGFTWAGRIGGFLGLWLLASVTSWLLGGFPLIFVLLEWRLFRLDPNSSSHAAFAFISSSLIAGLVCIGAMALSDRRYRDV